MLMNQWRQCTECKTKHLVATDRVSSRGGREIIPNVGGMGAPAAMSSSCLDVERMHVLLEECWIHRLQVELRLNVPEEP